MDKIPQSAAVLIPAYNAEASLGELVTGIHNSIGKIDIIIVDDGSKDSTFDIALSTGSVALRHEVNMGKGAALQTGFEYFRKYSDREYILTMDADLQHRPEDASNFFAVQGHTNADIVVGWRERTGTQMPVHRVLSNTVTSAMVGIRTGTSIKDSQCGFRLVHRKVIENIRVEAPGYEAETEFLIKAARRGYRIEFVPVKTVYGNEKSYMTHWETTMNFIKVLFRDY